MERVISLLEGFSLSSEKFHLVNHLGELVAPWPRREGSEASWALLSGLVRREQNFAPLYEKLLLELVT